MKKYYTMDGNEVTREDILAAYKSGNAVLIQRARRWMHNYRPYAGW